VSRLQSSMILGTGSNGPYVLINYDPLRLIYAYSTPSEIGREAGGILIGSYRGPHVEIVSCTAPLKRDVRLKYSFDRRDAGHQKQALAAWRSSGGTLTFVGEWHTHPERFPTPSMIDRRTWAGIVSESQHPCIFLIQGISGLWCGMARKGSLSELSILNDRPDATALPLNGNSVNF